MIRQNYLVLSGGLGSSAYVQKRLKTAFTGANFHPAAPSLKVIAAENDEPYDFLAGSDDRES